jgi:hypothetical protein
MRSSEIAKLMQQAACVRKKIYFIQKKWHWPTLDGAINTWA